MKLKILSWNIWFHGNLQKVNKFLLNSDAEIIGLQEVMQFDNKIQLSKELLNKYSNYLFAKAFEFPIKGKPVNVGNAILSKYPIKDYKIHNLSIKENRIAIQSDIKVGNKIIHIVCTHLLHTHQKPSKTQDKQASNLIKVVPHDKTVIMGDFNALPESNAIRIIDNVFENTDNKLLPTWSNYPEGCNSIECRVNGIIYKLDNIFVSKDLRSSQFKVESSLASDHLPISAVVEI